MIRSENFRNVCEDLAAADQVLANIDRLPDTLRETRRAEAEEWIERLTEEIRSMLYSAKILPIAHGRHKFEFRR
jgi:hypothetical protein